MSTKLILGIIFLLLSALFIALKKAYYSTPLKELKRRSMDHDPLASSLYRVAVYGNNLSALLWIAIGLSSAASFILLARAMPIWLGLFILAALIYIYFSFLPTGKVSRFSLKLAQLLSPLLAYKLNYLNRPLNRLSTKLEPHYNSGQHSGLYEKDDLLGLLKRQANQLDSRLTKEELDQVKRSLLFDDRKVAEVTVPTKKVKTINPNDTIGPILINDLHENPLKLVLVKDSPKGDLIGSLAFSDLNIHSEGKVRDVMNNQLFYINENANLYEALNVFLSTGQNVLVVIDNSEEYIGIITIKAVLEKLIGHIKPTNPDDYLNRSLVANPDEKTASESVKTD